jgi:hypothetical protein
MDFLRRRKSCVPIIDRTTSSTWLMISHVNVTVPRFGLVLEGRTSVAVERNRSVSPGRTGLRNRISSMPGEPTQALSLR